MDQGQLCASVCALVRKNTTNHATSCTMRLSPNNRLMLKTKKFNPCIQRATRARKNNNTKCITQLRDGSSVPSYPASSLTQGQQPYREEQLSTVICWSGKRFDCKKLNPIRWWKGQKFAEKTLGKTVGKHFRQRYYWATQYCKIDHYIQKPHVQ